MKQLGQRESKRETIDSSCSDELTRYSDNFDEQIMYGNNYDEHKSKAAGVMLARMTEEAYLEEHKPALQSEV